jgi:hypothetical protein
MRHARIYLLLLFALPITNTSAVAQSSSSPQIASSYPHTAAGLEQLATAILSLQRNGDTVALAPYLQSLVLPDAERWFTSEFGNTRCGEQQLGPNDCLGPRMALSYRTVARALPASFALTLADLLHEGLTNFEATNYTEECPGPQRILPSRELVGGLTTTPYLSSVLSGLVQRREPTYVLWAYNEHKETTLPFFVYVDGAFRYVGMLHPASVEDFQRGNAAAEEAGAAAQGHYLTEDQLEMKKVIVEPALVEHSVVLSVRLDADGKVEDVTYVRGPAADKEAAIQKVKKRHFDKPGFGPGGFHGNILCLSIAASH